MSDIDSNQGFCLWFTGLSGSGKSTLAQSLDEYFMRNGRVTTVLDGDAVRAHLSKELGFSVEDRNTNVKRIGYVASEVVKHKGVVICAAISPYEDSRQAVRDYFIPGHFIEIYISTPLEVCEERDVKGLYKRARNGEISGFTGIDDEYQRPSNPEITIDASKVSVEDATNNIVDFLSAKSLI